MNGAEALHRNESMPVSKEEAYSGVAERLRQLLDALNEAVEAYNTVTLPDGTAIEAQNAHEQMLARAQTLKSGVEGLIEQMRERDEHFAERATSISNEAIGHLEGYLAARTDLMNQAERNPGARELAEVIDSVATALLSTETANDSAYEVERQEEA